MSAGKEQLRYFRISSFIDDSNVQACHVGSGPINGGGKFAERRDRSEMCIISITILNVFIPLIQ